MSNGGKDSLCMVANVCGETVMPPGNVLLISAYVGCADVTQVVDPDLIKLPPSSLVDAPVLIPASTPSTSDGGSAVPPMPYCADRVPCTCESCRPRTVVTRSDGYQSIIPTHAAAAFRLASVSAAVEAAEDGGEDGMGPSGGGEGGATGTAGGWSGKWRCFGWSGPGPAPAPSLQVAVAVPGRGPVALRRAASTHRKVLCGPASLL
ncbi:hypothetical protein Vretifemale_17881 [Volvox reticuliferus]|uniref:Uncharacterized protein n=1 Tax=Volvox reticuliferus TaxID=1737510 RepID=A0A8J4FV16_9CHLO|nr:hypothetical protein Vretifemale_17881 [Volvox reticuliferus]